MPELPDVEVFRKYAEKNFLKKTIQNVDLPEPRISRVPKNRLEAALKGKQLRKTARHGKYLFLEIEKNSWLAMHFGMTGFLTYEEDGGTQSPHARFVIRFKNGALGAFDDMRMLGRVDLAEGVEKFVKKKRLGPDALSVSWPAFRKILAGAKGSLKSFFMSQWLLAGVGNVYADEILFQAGYQPTADLKSVDAEGARRIYDAMRSVLKKAIALDAERKRFPPGYLIRRRKNGADCPKCAGKVKMIAVNGRSTYFCPACQKK
jgi:formamidopyrimidine-DNA glycosylase